jgi:hypothetical protein
MYVGFRVKYPLFFLDFNETWILWADFRKMQKKKSNFIKKRPVLAVLLADRRTFRQDKAFVAFRSFANAPKR